MTHLNLACVAVYASVASLIEADAIALVISSAAIWPVGIPLLTGLLALAYYLRTVGRRRQGRHHNKPTR